MNNQNPEVSGWIAEIDAHLRSLHRGQSPGRTPVIDGDPSSFIPASSLEQSVLRALRSRWTQGVLAIFGAGTVGSLVAACTQQPPAEVRPTETATPQTCDPDEYVKRMGIRTPIPLGLQAPDGIVEIRRLLDSCQPITPEQQQRIDNFNRENPILNQAPSPEDPTKWDDETKSVYYNFDPKNPHHQEIADILQQRLTQARKDWLKQKGIEIPADDFQVFVKYLEQMSQEKRLVTLSPTEIIQFAQTNLSQMKEGMIFPEGTNKYYFAGHPAGGYGLDIKIKFPFYTGSVYNPSYLGEHLGYWLLSGRVLSVVRQPNKTADGWGIQLPAVIIQVQPELEQANIVYVPILTNLSAEPNVWGGERYREREGKAFSIDDRLHTTGREYPDYIARYGISISMDKLFNHIGKFTTAVGANGGNTLGFPYGNTIISYARELYFYNW